MTLHIHYNHTCPKCDAYYIPYDDAVPCPRCGLIETERFDFVPEAARSALFNIQVYGSFVPSAWYVGSYGDHVLMLIFSILEQYRVNKKDTTFQTVVRAIADKMEFGDQEYAREYVVSLSARIFEEISKISYEEQNSCFEH